MGTSIEHKVRVAATAAMTGPSLLAASTPASALGSGSAICRYYLDGSGFDSFSGRSTSAYAATWQSWAGECGNVGARVYYRTYPGSPIYYTTYTYDPSYVQRNPGNTVVSGSHVSTSVTWPGSSHFNT